MTAIDSFYAAIEDGNIPASVPVPEGLTTVIFAGSTPDVHAMANGSHHERAKLAVYACNAAIEAATESAQAAESR